MITFQDFQKMQLVVGRVTSVEAHPDADKLYLMQIDLGGETKQSVAGLRPYFTPEQLVGKLVAVVANIQPATLRGQESQCMILCAQDGDRVICLTPDEEVPVGSTIR